MELVRYVMSERYTNHIGAARVRPKQLQKPETETGPAYPEDTSDAVPQLAASDLARLSSSVRKCLLLNRRPRYHRGCGISNTTRLGTTLRNQSDVSS